MTKNCQKLPKWHKITKMPNDYQEWPKITKMAKNPKN